MNYIYGIESLGISDEAKNMISAFNNVIKDISNIKKEQRDVLSFDDFNKDNDIIKLSDVKPKKNNKMSKITKNQTIDKTIDMPKQLPPEPQNVQPSHLIDTPSEKVETETFINNLHISEMKNKLDESWEDLINYKEKKNNTEPKHKTFGQNQQSNEIEKQKCAKDIEQHLFGNGKERPQFSNNREQAPYQNDRPRPSYQNDQSRPPYQNNRDRPPYQNDRSRPQYQNDQSRPQYQNNRDRPPYQNDRSRPPYQNNRDQPQYQNDSAKTPHQNDREQPQYQNSEEPPQHNNWRTKNTNSSGRYIPPFERNNSGNIQPDNK
jgi:hypothetical protein